MFTIHPTNISRINHSYRRKLTVFQATTISIVLRYLEYLFYNNVIKTRWNAQVSDYKQCLRNKKRSLQVVWMMKVLTTIAVNLLAVTEVKWN